MDLHLRISERIGAIEMKSDRIVVKQALRNLLENTQKDREKFKDEYYDMKEVGKNQVARLALSDALEADKMAKQLKKLINEYSIKH
jgi:hypothetical protein